MPKKERLSQIPPTPLGALYDALCALTARERTALAEVHAKAPHLLRNRFLRSVEIIEKRPPSDETFYDTSRKAPPTPPTAPAKINSTIKFTSHLCDGKRRGVTGVTSLAFLYVDREIFPARTKGDSRAQARKLDLLLANAGDGLPVVAELKAGPDRDAYFALVQGLMHASELQSLSQRRRLRDHPGGDIFRWPDSGPFADVYIIAFNSPDKGTYRARAFDASARIAESLIADERFSRHVRRIAYLDAKPKSRELTFEKRLAFGPGT